MPSVDQSRLAALGDISYLSVSELTNLLNRVLEDSLPEVFFEGEISEVTRARSGHLYFTVKDAKSQISAVMWSGLVDALDFDVVQGLSVQCHGKPNVYRGSGRLQIVVHKLFPAGEGALRKKFLELKAKLEKEGFFAEQRKRKLPFLPRAIGVVTSGTGAVIHDIMVRIRERMPNLQVYLVDVKVQGEGAAQEIAAGVRLLDQSKLVDVIIVARGGGSLEDLWAFNEEAVVKAIFASSTPVVSGVGHEVDVSLSDLVADVRAPTPTAAAEIVVPRRDELLQRIAEYERRLSDVERWLGPLAQQLDDLSLRFDQRMRTIVETAALRLAHCSTALKAIEPLALVNALGAKVDLLAQRLAAASLTTLKAAQRQLDTGEARLHRAFPLQKIHLASERLSSLVGRLQSGSIRSQQEKSAVIERLSAKLEAVSPKRVMRRGFSIVESRGSLIRSSGQLETGDPLSILFAEGSVSATVLQKK